MSALQTASQDATPATGLAPTIAITVAGANPALIVGIGLDSATAVVNSVSWSLGSGAPAVVQTVRSSNGAYIAVWKIPAPVAGAGTVTVANSASVLYIAQATAFSGAHQTDPAPAANAVTSNSAAGPLTLTPTGLVAGDATYGMGVNIIAGNWVAATPNQRSLNNSSNPGYMVGDATNTTGVTFDNDAGMNTADISLIVVRVAQAPAAVNTALNEPEWHPLEPQTSPLTVSLW